MLFAIFCSLPRQAEPVITSLTAPQAQLFQGFVRGFHRTFAPADSRKRERRRHRRRSLAVTTTRRKRLPIIRFLLYALRWQLSTPILYPVVRYFGSDLWSVALANLAGASIFFWVDRFIFSSRVQEWEFVELGRCHDCGRYGSLKRLRYDPRGYDRRDDPDPEFRCKECSERKLREIDLRRAG